jgi:hypothetical protein
MALSYKAKRGGVAACRLFDAPQFAKSPPAPTHPFLSFPSLLSRATKRGPQNAGHKTNHAAHQKKKQKKTNKQNKYKTKQNKTNKEKQMKSENTLVSCRRSTQEDGFQGRSL